MSKVLTNKVLKVLTNKVLLIGWDAADWKVMTPLMDAGQMPNLARLVDRGVMGNLSTLTPVLSPMLWTSIATGKRAHKHGIHGFSEPNPDTGAVRPISSLSRKTRALWNMMQTQGKKSNVVGWWPSNPVEPIDGVMVSNLFHKVERSKHGYKPMPAGSVHPARLQENLEKVRIAPWEIDPAMLQVFVPDAASVDQDKDQRLASVAKVLAECATVHAAATAVMQLEPWDFMGVYFDAIDHFCHGFMKYHPPRLDWVGEADFELYKDVVNSGYRFHDLMLGAYMDLADDDTTIMIVSDHGFHPDHLRPKELPNEPAGPAEEHRGYGMIAACGPGIKKDELVFGASLLDVTPTILTLMGLPVGRDMDGKPLVNMFDQPVKVDYIDSWDQVPGDDGGHPADRPVDAVDTQAALQQLVDLGYIERPDEKIEVAVANTIKELQYNLARDYIDARQHLPAIEVLIELWAGYADESRFGVQLFNCYLALDWTSQAGDTFAQIVEQKKRYSKTAAAELAEYQQANKDKKAEDYSDAERQRIRKLSKKAGVNAHSLEFLRGNLLFAKKSYTEALLAYEKCITVQLHNRPVLYLRLGETHGRLKQWSVAKDWFNKALEIDPVNGQAQLGLAGVLLPVRKNQQALEHAMAAIGLNYHNPQAHHLAGTALHRLGRINEAVDALNIAVAQNPVFPAAHERLAKIYENRLKNSEKAAWHLGQAVDAKQRIKDFRRGAKLPTANEVAMDGLAVASIGEVGRKPVLSTMGPETVVIVSGLPRSGTSMLMQMLAAGGFPVLVDEQRPADESNKRGYYELEAVKQLKKNNHSWVVAAQGKAVKVIGQLLPNLPKGVNYRILFMERPLDEIVASQSEMLERLKKPGAAGGSRRLAQTYKKQIEQIGNLLAGFPESVGVMSMNYHHVLSNPAAAAQQINTYLGGVLDEQAMVAAVAPELRNQRSA